MMTSIDHGKWTSYKPSTLPPSAPSGALYVRRESDGVDWYAYLKADTHFGSGTVKFTALWQEVFNGYVVSVAVYDATMLFPVEQLVREVTDYTGSDPQTDFGNKLYDPATDTISPLPQPVLASTTSDLEARVAALEAKQGGQ